MRLSTGLLDSCFTALKSTRTIQRGMLGTAPEQLFVQYVIVTRSVQEEDFRFSVLGEDVVVDGASLPSVHVLHQDTHAQGLR